MNARDEQLLEEALAHLDFEPKCEVLRTWQLALLGAVIPLASRTCANPARWIAVCRSCGASAPECDDCHQLSKSQLVSCLICGTSGSVEELFVTSQLPGGA